MSDERKKTIEDEISMAAALVLQEHGFKVTLTESTVQDSGGWIKINFAEGDDEQRSHGEVG